VRLRVPHTFVLLLLLVALAAIATHVIPAGEYTRVERDGRQVVDPASYRAVAARPAGPGEVLLAWPRGLAATSEIVFFIFIMGGAFSVFAATGAIEKAIDRLVAQAGQRGDRVIPVLMLAFALAGGSAGMAEETLVFLPTLVVLARRLGYDTITGGAIALVGAGAGFAGAFLNPFTVGVAQGIAELPLFSGLGLRLVAWSVVTALAILHVSRHARRVRGASGPGTSPEPHGGPLAARHVAVLVLLFGTLLAVAVGSLSWGWGLVHLSGLFIAAAVLAGLLSRLGADATAERFLDGAAAITTGALVVGLARGVLVVLDGARVTDTLLFWAAAGVEGLPRSVAVAGIYAVQVALNFLVPSGSGQAALSIPILAPLGDLVGVTRQTTVLAYQFGDGFTNIFSPTSGYFMAGLALIGVRWSDWARFIWPLMLQWLVAGFALLMLAHSVGYGPF
jgi:uncharacterized ion transporter superfamily protein YfcC